YIHLPDHSETCVICFDDIDSDVMFSVDKCSHRFCFECMKHHIEVKLLEGTIPNCPQHRCKSQLSIDSCSKLLTLKQSLAWKQRIKEDSTPFTEKVYCPYPRCSYLMSKTELSTCSDAGLRTCFKCSGSFCVHCKVPWHSKLSCTAFKKWHRPRNDDAEFIKSLAKFNGWRQCAKCQHMIEHSSGCARVKCRYACVDMFFVTTVESNGTAQFIKIAYILGSIILL
ncbi:E3 ubiquitin-protein ligase dbl4, partial [Eutrema salsugineum]|uniref:E3 ubiquitin-protein ligase dbl4 n=1 Tax=Eutrema salsugineum TaxID=72664 RepID=UPI000CED2E16